jgi:AraC family transcriptional regulator
MIAMATFASNGSESNGVSRDGINRAPIGRSHLRAIVDANSWSPFGDAVVHPTVSITPAESVRRLGTGWHWWFSESVHIPIGSKIEFRFRGNTHLLVLYNEGVRKNGETSIDGLQSSGLRSFARKLTFVPAGCAYREWHETDAPTRIAFLYLDPAAFQKSGDGEGSLLPPRIYFEDSVVWDTTSKLRNTVESGQTRHKPYLEALSGVLAHELSRVNLEFAHEPATRRGGLAGWQKRAVLEYIEAHLGEQVCLLKLADLTRLSVHHFCRAFKQSIGIPAHQYQVHRRMEVAKLLLADQTMSVTDIALRLGYAHTSSFGSAFRKTTGWTPTVYRREFK